MRHYWLMYQTVLSKIFLKTVWYPNSSKQCGIYTMGQLSKLYVIIRLGETNTNRNQDSILRFLIVSFGDKILSFLIQELSLSFPFIIPLGVMVNYGDLQLAERIMVVRWSEMSAEWKVKFAVCIASVAIQAFTKLLLTVLELDFRAVKFCSPLDGIWTHTIDTLQHHSLSLTSSALGASITVVLPSLVRQI